MNFDEVKNKIEAWLQPLLTEKNFFLVDIKFPMGRQIEVYVDSDEGIHISECAELSRFLEKNLDESGLVPENYILEVSSPGMTNPLKVPRQYKRRIGRILEITKTNGQQLEAKLLAVDDDKITLEEVLPEVKKKKKKGEEPVAAEPKVFALHYAEIKRALIQFKF